VPTNVELARTPAALAEDCDALVLVTDWQVFRELDYGQLARSMKTPILIDGRNYLNTEAIVKAGFHYVGIGRPVNGNVIAPLRIPVEKTVRG
jgi:UDPglucose 6-dehydrogenase